MTAAVQSESGEVYPASDLLPATALAAAFEVPRTTMSAWIRRYADFPAPVIAVGPTRLWSATEVRAWLAEAAGEE